MSSGIWKFKETAKAVKNVRLILDIAKNAYPKAKTVHRKKKEEGPSICKQGNQINPQQ